MNKIKNSLIIIFLSFLTINSVKSESIQIDGTEYEVTSLQKFKSEDGKSNKIRAVIKNSKCTGIIIVARIEEKNAEKTKLRFDGVIQLGSDEAYLFAEEAMNLFRILKNKTIK